MWVFLVPHWMYVGIVIHEHPAKWKTLAVTAVYLYGIHPSSRCRGEVLFKELPFPTLFLEGWHMTTISIDSFILPPLPSLLAAGHQALFGAEMPFALLTFSIVFLSLSPFLFHFSPHLSSFLACPPIYRGDKVIRAWAVVSYPIHFYLCLQGLIPESHMLLSQSTSPPQPTALVFERGKSQLDSLSPQSSAPA